MQEHSYFPVTLGNEEETRNNLIMPAVNERPAHHEVLKNIESRQVNRGIDRYCPPLPGSEEFRENGSRTYVDKYSNELCTPEVATPDDQIAYTKANVALLEKSLCDYVQRRSKGARRPFSCIWQRRVIDDQGNTWGCHDNFSIRDAGYEHQVAYSATDVGRLWEGYLYSRPFITGAMFIGYSNAYFSQKLSAPHDFQGYGYLNSLVRVDTAPGPRFEVRCNDINLQDWAYLSRIGGVALVLAASQTRLGSEIAKSKEYRFGDIDAGWNMIPLKSDLELFSSRAISRALDIQRFTLITILDKFEDYADEPIPEVYRRIGESTLQYCDDFEQVLYGIRDLSDLSDRTDWAAKLHVVRQHFRRHPQDRWLGDQISRNVDLLYDRIEISQDQDGKIETRHGYGYAMAARNSVVSDATVKRAMRTPPPDTQASVRVHAAKRLGAQVKSCDWHLLRIDDGNNGERSVSLTKLSKAS